MASDIDDHGHSQRGSPSQRSRRPSIQISYEAFEQMTNALHVLIGETENIWRMQNPGIDPPSRQLDSTLGFPVDNAALDEGDDHENQPRSLPGNQP